MTEKTLAVPLALDCQEDIVLAARNGDMNAFGQLISQYERSLYRVSRTVLKSDHDCADAVQEALTKAWLSMHTLREPCYFRTWLIRILLNECYRLAKKTKLAIPTPGLQSQQGNDVSSDNLIDLKDALDALPLHHRTVIVLYHVEELTVDEIARILNVPSGTVKSRLARARTKLAAYMQPKEEDHWINI